MCNTWYITVGNYYRYHMHYNTLGNVIIILTRLNLVVTVAQTHGSTASTDRDLWAAVKKSRFFAIWHTDEVINAELKLRFRRKNAVRNLPKYPCDIFLRPLWYRCLSMSKRTLTHKLEETRRRRRRNTHVDNRHEPAHGIILNRDLTLTLPAGWIDRQDADIAWCREPYPSLQ